MPLVYIPGYKDRPPAPISAFFSVCVKVKTQADYRALDCVRLPSERRREQHSCPKAFKVNSQGIWEMCEGGHVSASELDSDSDRERDLTQTHV